MPDNQSSTKPTHIPRGRFRGAFLFAMKRHLHAAGIYLCSKCNQWCTDFGSNHYLCKPCLKQYQHDRLIKRGGKGGIRPTKTIKCPKCGIKRVVRPSSPLQFCSRRCHDEWKRGRKRGKRNAFKPRPCSTCGEIFQPDGMTRKRCLECRKCPICGKLPKRARYRFCSTACADEWHRQHPKPSPLLGIPRPDKRGPLSPHWKGGTSRSRDTMTFEYRLWRQTVFKRDSYRCVICGSDAKIQAHHVLTWRDHVALRLDPDNGVTLCYLHHIGMRRNEHLYAERFIALVKLRQPLLLTSAEVDVLRPKTIICRFCERVVPSERNRTQHSFCDWECKRAWQKAHRDQDSTQLGPC